MSICKRLQNDSKVNMPHVRSKGLSPLRTLAFFAADAHSCPCRYVGMCFCLPAHHLQLRQIILYIYILTFLLPSDPCLALSNHSSLLRLLSAARSKYFQATR